MLRQFWTHPTARPLHPIPPRAQTGPLHAPRTLFTISPSMECASTLLPPMCLPIAASARVVLPHSFHTYITMHGVLPDVLALNSAVPQPDAPPNTYSLGLYLRPGAGAPHPLSHSPPPCAFVHIRPDMWLNAMSVHVPLHILVTSHSPCLWAISSMDCCLEVLVCLSSQ